MNDEQQTPVVEDPDGTPPDYPRDGGVDGPVLISNEFADVVVRKVMTRNGMRLEIWSPRRGSSVLLDAVALDCLSYSSPELITELLSQHPGA